MKDDKKLIELSYELSKKAPDELTGKCLSDYTEDQLDMLIELGYVERKNMGMVSEEEGIKIITDILRHLRSKAGLTQVEVAKIIGYSNAQLVSMVERGVTKIPYDKINKFVRAYGADTRLHAAIVKLTYPEAWSDALTFVDLAGGIARATGGRVEAGSFDHEINLWVNKNKV